MKTLLGTLIAMLALPPLAGAQPVADHLQCYKVKDPAPKAAYTADLGGLTAAPGCMIKVPAVMACVPTTKTNVQPAPPGGGGTGTPNTFGCYKVKCPKAALPPIQLNDQFGSRMVVPSASKVLCAPSCLYVPFAPVIDDVLDAFRLDASGNLNVPASCNTTTPVCCPGGTPVSPCGPLQFDFVQQAGDPPSVLTPKAGAPNEFDATILARLKTVNDIPVTIPLAGDCGLHIDTTPGPSPQIQIDMPVFFSADRLRMGPVGPITITDLTTDDVSLTGGFACQVANLGLSFYLSTLTNVIADDLAFGNLCRDCVSKELVDCGP